VHQTPAPSNLYAVFAPFEHAGAASVSTINASPCLRRAHQNAWLEADVPAVGCGAIPFRIFINVP